ncbi:MAG: hypothetical protein AAF191_02535 [Verrucomicrobiota bacterium]
MPLWLLMGMASFVVGHQTVQAQLIVTAEPSKKLYVAYEPVMVKVSILNRAGRDIVLADKGSTSWLTFQVTDSTGHLLSPHSRTSFEPVLIPAGQMLSREIPVNASYSMTRRGLYRIQASAYFPQLDRYFPSRAKTLQITEAKEMWSQAVGVPEGHPKAGTFRRLVLSNFHDGAKKFLYLRIQDEESGVVYASFSLGQVILVRKPTWNIDRKNQLHVLHMGAPQTYAHSVVDVDGKIVSREIYYEKNGIPSLVSDGSGGFLISGGISEKEANRDPLEADVRKISERPEGLPDVP